MVVVVESGGVPTNFRLTWLSPGGQEGSNPHPFQTQDANSNHNTANMCFAIPEHWFESRAAGRPPPLLQRALLSCGMFCGCWPAQCIFIEAGSRHVYTDGLFFPKDEGRPNTRRSCFIVSDSLRVLNEGANKSKRQVGLCLYENWLCFYLSCCLSFLQANFDSKQDSLASKRRCLIVTGLADNLGSSLILLKLIIGWVFAILVSLRTFQSILFLFLLCLPVFLLSNIKHLLWF